MYDKERIQLLYSLLLARGYLDVKTVAKELGVSLATARRDIRYLTGNELAERTHGGIHLLTVHSTTHENTLNEKRRLMTAEKQAIGQLAGKLIFPGQSVLIDAGSTTYQVARFLRSNRPSMIVSNDVFILSLLAKSPDMHLIDPGGTIRSNYGTLLGPETVEFISNIHVNIAFLGADAVDVKKGITITNQDEVMIKQAMIESADRVILVCDHSKFGKDAFARVCDLQSIHTCVTDRGISQDQAQKIQTLGIELLIASEEEDTSQVQESIRKSAPLLVDN